MITNSVIDPDELESERKVILEEIAMHEDAPDELVHDLFYRAMWDGHPSGARCSVSTRPSRRCSAIRSPTTGGSATRPSNLVVAAAGNVDHDELVDRGRRRSSSTPTGRKTLRDRHRALAAGRGRASTSGRPSRRTSCSEPRVCTAATTTGTRSRVLDTILGGGMSSRLFQEIREKRGLAYSVYSYRSLFADTGTFAVYAGTTPQNAETVIDIVRERDRLASSRNGITDAELERAKGHVKGSLVLSSEDPGSRMNRLGRQQLTTGEILSIDELIARFDALEMDDIRRVADRRPRPRAASGDHRRALRRGRVRHATPPDR